MNKKIIASFISVSVFLILIGASVSITSDPGDPVNKHSLSFDPGDPINIMKDPGDPIN